MVINEKKLTEESLSDLYQSGQRVKAKELVNQALKSNNLSQKQYYNFSCLLAEFQISSGEKEEALKLLEKIHDEIDDTKYIAETLRICSLLSHVYKESAKRQNILEETISTYGYLEDETSEKSIIAALGEIYHMYGRLLTSKGKYQEAVKNVGHSLDLYQTIGDIKREAQARYAIGSMYSNLNEFELAETNLQIARKLQEEVGNTYGLGYTNMGLGYIYLKQDKVKEAKAAYDIQFEIFMELGDDEQKAWAYTDQGNCYLAMDEVEKALEYFHKALPLYEKKKDEVTMANQYTYISDAYRKLGKYQDSLDYDDKAIELYKIIDHIPHLIKTYLSKSKTFHLTSDIESAIENVELAFDTYNQNKEENLTEEFIKYKQFLTEQNVEINKTISEILSKIR